MIIQSNNQMTSRKEQKMVVAKRQGRSSPSSISTHLVKQRDKVVLLE